MKRITVLVEVNDKFEKGMCYDCPFFAHTEYWDDRDGYYGYRSYKECVLEDDSGDCPIEAVEEVEE